jgi:ferredoxin
MSMGAAGCSVVDAEACLGCGVCVSVCPDDAIELVRYGDVEPVPWSRVQAADVGAPSARASAEEQQPREA